MEDSTPGNTTGGGIAIDVLYKILTSNTTTSTGVTLSPTFSTNAYGTILGTFQETQSSVVVVDDNGHLD